MGTRCDSMLEVIFDVGLSLLTFSISALLGLGLDKSIQFCEMCLLVAVGPNSKP